MPEVKSYKAGELNWTDLATTDQAAAKKFYSNLFGWNLKATPMPDGGEYTMAEVSGKDVGAISTMRDDEKKMGVPPHWNIYFAVTNVDESVKKATSIGGKVLAPAMDVMDVGRMAVLADPSGAPFCVWQAQKHIGASINRENGAFCWAELDTRNVDACGSFYSKLFGWRPDARPMGNMTYTVFQDGKDERAGMMPTDKNVPAHIPSHWTIYFQVADCDAITKKATSTGAKALVPPTDIPNVGRFAILSDPQGAVFGLLKSTQK